LILNNNYQKGNFEKIIAYDLLSQSISHMDNKDNLDERSFFMTIKLRHKSDIDKVLKPIFIKINNVLYSKTIGSGSQKSSMIICGDVEGSRLHIPEFKRPIYPHLHALLILSHEDHLVWKDKKEVLIALLNIEISSLLEVKSFDQNPVWIKPFDINKGSIIDTVAYIGKAFFQAQKSSLEFGASRVFPFEIECTKRPDTPWIGEKDKCYSQLIYDPRQFFSDAHQIRLSEAHLAVIDQGKNLTGTELEKHIQRFVRTVETGGFML